MAFSIAKATENSKIPVALGVHYIALKRLCQALK
jgi:hypothetical protein